MPNICGHGQRKSPLRRRDQRKDVTVPVPARSDLDKLSRRHGTALAAHNTNLWRLQGYKVRIRPHRHRSCGSNCRRCPQRTPRSLHILSKLDVECAGGGRHDAGWYKRHGDEPRDEKAPCDVARSHFFFNCSPLLCHRGKRALWVAGGKGTRNAVTPQHPSGRPRAQAPPLLCRMRRALPGNSP